MLTTSLASAVAAALLLPTALPSPQPTVDKIAGMLKEAGAPNKIKRVLAAQQQDSLMLHDIRVGPPTLESGNGPIIRQALARALEEEQIKVVDKASMFQLTADATVLVHPQLKTARVQIRLHLGNVVTGENTDIPFEGQEVFTIDSTQGNNNDVIAVVGGATNVELTGNREDVNQQLGMHLEKVREGKAPPPPIAEGGTSLLAGDYGLQIQVKGKALPLAPAKSNSGLAFVDIPLHEVYEVVLINNDAKSDAAVELLIDGISMFTFSLEQVDSGGSAKRPKYTHVIIPKASSGVIKGWHRTNQHSDEFKVVELPQAAVTEVRKGGSAEVGTITAKFRRAYVPGDPAAQSAPNEGQEPKATGRGDKTDAPYKEEIRVFGPPELILSVRYDKSP